MSYDMVVQRFEQGAAAPMAGDAFVTVIEPRVDRREPQHSYWHISTDDGGTADVYAALAGGTLDSLMISRFSAGAVLDMLVNYIGLADALVLPPGCPTLLAHEGQRHHLPDELRVDAVVVQAGADVERVLQSCGRAAGVIVVAATQRPSSDIVPTSLRDLLGYRLAFRCSTDASSDVILGHGWANEGYTAADIDRRPAASAGSSPRVASRGGSSRRT